MTHVGLRKLRCWGRRRWWQRPDAEVVDDGGRAAEHVGDSQRFTALGGRLFCRETLLLLSGAGCGFTDLSQRLHAANLCIAGAFSIDRERHAGLLNSSESGSDAVHTSVRQLHAESAPSSTVTTKPKPFKWTKSAD
jgi:hypothetical protein